jgi:hypothetical protein
VDVAATNPERLTINTRHKSQRLTLLCRLIRSCLKRGIPTQKAKTPNSSSAALQKLTAAALALPGVIGSGASAAETESAVVQYGHYEEGKRQLYGYNAKFDPLTVDSLNANGSFNFLERFRFGFNFAQDTWAGATPVTSLPFRAMERLSDIQILAGASAKPDTSSTPAFRIDDRNNIYTLEGTFPKIRFAKDNRLIHMMTSASPETRKQADGRLGYEWDEAALGAGAGVSMEKDYTSRFFDINGRMDFNRKLTTLTAGYSHTAAQTNVLLPDTWNGWTSSEIGSELGEIKTDRAYPNGNPKLVVKNLRHDWSANVGITQVLSKSAVLQGSFGYTSSTGYLENAYKIVSFISRGEALGLSADGQQLYNPALTHIYEQRPNERNQFNWTLGFIHHIPVLDAALHTDYRFFQDDWGISSHTFETAWEQPLGKGWSVTPRFRYYSQSAADFYYPYVNCNDQQGVLCAKSLKNFSSDHRLSAFGALSGGIVLSKQFAKGVTFEASGEYYTHQGSLKLGGKGEGAYADFDYYAVNAALKVDLAAAFNGNTGLGADIDLEESTGHENHAGHHTHMAHHKHATHGPAGVMFDHMLDAGDFMVGYRYMFGRQIGDMLNGSHVASDREIVAQGGCDSPGCSVRPGEMNMSMHMIDLMYAPTDWLTLMVMPQFVDMDMKLDPLEGGIPSVHSSHVSHETGGVGDTGLYGLVKLWGTSIHHLHATIGVSAPTGDANIRLNPVAGHSHNPNLVIQPEYLHYGMQLGSGTWDFKPSLTYTGRIDQWSWGAQISGTKRLEDRNDEGYALGDSIQSTAWGSYDLLDWLSASVRGLYTEQGKVRGVFNRHSRLDIASNTTTYLSNSINGPMDSPNSYGGRYWDVGFGLNLMIPSGSLQGNHLSFEWLHPVSDDVNGYQLERKEGFFATWGLMF